MKTYHPPDNLIELLATTANTARKTAFYQQRLEDIEPPSSLNEFEKLPLTALAEYRMQKLGDVVSNGSDIQWIVGAYKGQVPGEVALAEGIDESVNRYDLFADPIKERLIAQRQRVCAVITSSKRRYFAAEMSSILIYAGMPTHVYINRGDDRTYGWLDIVNPDVLVVLTDDLNELALPNAIELCVTFRQSHRIERFSHLDYYLVDELGFLGHSDDCVDYAMNRDTFYFETSESGKLIVTDLYNRTRPLLRIETDDKVILDDKGFARLIELAY